jgi:hypothetical protein
MTSKTLRILLTLVALALAAVMAAPVMAKPTKARFYDFSDQLIDGEVKKPTAIYMESRARAKFAKLLRLKKSFKQAMINSSKEPILK